MAEACSTCPRTMCPDCPRGGRVPSWSDMGGLNVRYAAKLLLAAMAEHEAEMAQHDLRLSRLLDKEKGDQDSRASASPLTGAVFIGSH